MRIYAYTTAPLKALLFIAFVFSVFFLYLLNIGYAQENDTGQPIADLIEGKTGTTTDAEVPLESASEMTLNNFMVTPVVANEKAKPRDIIKKELLVTNNTEQRIDLYISVENVDPTQGAQDFVSPAVSDLSTSLANWVEITRGVIELSPGESRKIPYLIHVNLTAKPGSYYARIQFREGARRDVAEASKEGTALMLNVEVFDDATERLQLGNFISEDSVIFGNTVSFTYLLENVGNRLIEPRGSIRIFNRRGEEVGSVPLNAEGEEITPENKKQLAAAWSAAGRFGKYKAFLDLEYGENQLASVQDTVYFWVFPWKEIFASLVGVVVLAIVGTYIVHIRSIAQPARARARQTTTNIHNETQSHAHVSAVHQGSMYGHPATHLAVLRTNGKSVTMPSQTKAPARQHGIQVELTSRNQPNVQGNVVQLQKRR